MHDDIHTTLTRAIEQMQKDPEYQENCLRFSQECDRLEGIFNKLSQQRESLQAYCDANTVRKEHASGSNLHRGFYCPSPTEDVIIGGTKRGKLLKRLTAASKPTHEYGFDGDGKLLYCATFYQGQVATTEYLVYEDQRIYGITFSQDGCPNYLTEEIFSNGRLTEYTFCISLRLHNSSSSRRITFEHYEYDEEGLCLCSMHTYHDSSSVPSSIPESILAMIPKVLYQHMGDFRFRRENGLLVSYTNKKGHEYRALTKRKA